MMRTIQVSEGQTALDIALEYCGTLDVVFDIADLNGLESFTDLLTAGMLLKVPDVVDEFISGEFNEAYKKPVSDDTFGWDGRPINPDEEGIDFWEIETQFEVQ
jgi:hypothetical protein